MTEPGYDEGWPRWDLPRDMQHDLLERYYGVLGRFIHYFSNAERAVNQAIEDILQDVFSPTFVRGLYPEPNAARDRVLRAITGSLRLASARDTLKRLLRVLQAPQNVTDEIDAVLNQLGEIHYLRDRIAHDGVGWRRDKQDWFTTSNYYGSREHDRVETISFKIEALFAA